VKSVPLFQFNSVPPYLEKDPNHEPLINLFPSYADNIQLGANGFQDYLDKFIEIVEPAILSYDNYALLDDEVSTPETKDQREEVYFNDLKVVRETTRKAGIPFWNFILSAGVKCEGKGCLRVPTKSKILWQANTTLAYGARGGCWFCCWTPEIATMPGALELPEEYFGGMINGDGAKNPMFDYVSEANGFLRKNWRKLVDWDCAFAARYKNGKLVNGGSSFATPEGKNFNLVIGTFSKDNQHILVIANASYSHPAQFSLSLAEDFKEAETIDTISARFDGKNYKLEPGGCVIIKLSLKVEKTRGLRLRLRLRLRLPKLKCRPFNSIIP